MTKHLEYLEEDGIHIFKWYSANRRAVDTWIQWMNHIMIRDGHMGHILMDFSESELPPVRYMSLQIRRWLTRHVPPEKASKVAVVYPQGNMPFLIVSRSYSATLGRGRPTNIAFFAGDQVDDAYDWLYHHMGQNTSGV